MDLSLQKLLDIETDQIIWCDLSGKVIFVNTSAVRRFCKNENDIINNSIWNVYPESIKAHHQILWNQAIRNGHPLKVKNKLQESWFETTFSPISGGEGKAESVVLIAREISSVIEAEERF
ncbi:MAG: PAS domain-containing protein [Anaerolineaceae bacterium]